ncbi:gk24670, related [Neospora caninum Liverpool]|uniref:NOL1/NOP2/Sun domain family member 4 n=1 Tax=Neospora caninum (strain Liverpool) TaxID=572307 RepID=F0V8Q6_NEOCL|nr:gk24670, related [Neospora caninum Liverpool]CBZ50097.1 gk24670, related [Neospora caninum Liverpool]CEL64692.1 TPA: GK24670, related [Neospora caninum Liverpool]|eukprot:XP_003880132.1 gk24670, related [Neospora caninum Liverpool]
MSSRRPAKRPTAGASSGVVLRGASGWSAFHEHQYGSARWNRLLQALAGEGRFAAFVASAEGETCHRQTPAASVPPDSHKREDLRCTYTASSEDRKDARVGGGENRSCGTSEGTERNACANRPLHFQGNPPAFSQEVREELLEFLHLRTSGLPSPNVFLVPRNGKGGEEKSLDAVDEDQSEQSRPGESRASCHPLPPVPPSSSPTAEPSIKAACAVASSADASLSSPSPSGPSPSSVACSTGSSSVARSCSPSPCAASTPTSSSGFSTVTRDRERSAQETALLETLEKEKVYYLDGASAFAACTLRVSPGDRILDLCAAPGGKSLVLASMLFSSTSSPPVSGSVPPSQKQKSRDAGLLVCNEASRPRMERLQKVLHTFLPPEIFNKRLVQVTCASGTKGGSYERFRPFDKILVDAPCSSDRHLLKQGRSALASWASGVPKTHAERQLQLLKGALGLLRVGGVLLYSTCALSEVENEKVVEKLLKSCGGSVKEIPLLVDPVRPASASGFSRVAVLPHSAPVEAAKETTETHETSGGRSLPVAVSPHSRHPSPGRVESSGPSDTSTREKRSEDEGGENAGDRPPLWILETRERGAIMLPDAPAGFGPLFMCKLQLVAPLQRRL